MSLTEANGSCSRGVNRSCVVWFLSLCMISRVMWQTCVSSVVQATNPQLFVAPLCPPNVVWKWCLWSFTWSLHRFMYTYTLASSPGSLSFSGGRRGPGVRLICTCEHNWIKLVIVDSIQLSGRCQVCGGVRERQTHSPAKSPTGLYTCLWSGHPEMRAPQHLVWPF